MKLEIGYNTDFEVRTAQYITRGDFSFSVLYLSDFHFNGFSAKMVQHLSDKIDQINPDVLLLGGDYVDTKRGFLYLNKFLQGFAIRKHVFAIAGNHDYFYGIKKIKAAFQRTNIHWIEQSSVTFQLNNQTLQIDGNLPQNRKEHVDFSILCLHQPIDLDACQNQYQLAFAGHLHGSQFVFWQVGPKLYPGRLFFRWNILQTQIGHCHYYISKGLGDTLPIRYNCKKDIIFIEITANAQNPVL